MPNWAYSTNIFVGNKEKLEEFEEKLCKIIAKPESRAWSLVETCRGFGIDPRSVECKGDIISIKLHEDKVTYLKVDQDSAWFGTPDLWRAIIKAGGFDFEYSYYVEEPGMNTYVKYNDVHALLPVWTLEHFECSSGEISYSQQYYFYNDEEMLEYFNDTYGYAFASFEELKSEAEGVLARISTEEVAESEAESENTEENPDLMFASEFAQMHFIQVIQDEKE